MFEEYFVTYMLAKVLRTAGFDVPCIGVWEYSVWDDKPEAELHINYLSFDTTDHIYNKEIQALLKSRPGLFQDKRTNQTLPPWLFAAPLYDQVFAWLFKKGLYLHPYYAPKFEGKKAVKAQWGVNIYDLDLKFLNAGGLLAAMEGEPVNADRRDAIEQAILAAIKLLKNE